LMDTENGWYNSITGGVQQTGGGAW